MKEEDIKYTYEKGVPAFPAEGSCGKEDMSKIRIVKPVIDSSKCIKCKKCWLFCPESAIDWKDRPVINYKQCKGCMICFNECPVKAIREEKEWKS